MFGLWLQQEQDATINIILGVNKTSKNKRFQLDKYVSKVVQKPSLFVFLPHCQRHVTTVPILKNCAKTALSTTVMPWVRLARAYWRNLPILHTRPHPTSHTLKNGLQKKPCCEKNTCSSTVSRWVSWMRMFSVVFVTFFITSTKYLLGMRVAKETFLAYEKSKSLTLLQLQTSHNWAAFVLKHLTPLFLISLPGSRQSCLNYCISTVQRVKLTGLGEQLS